MDFEKHSETRHFFNLLSMGMTGVDTLPSAALSKGWYIAIDIDMTKEHSSGYNFRRDSVKTVGRGTLDSNSNIIEAAGGIAQSINEARESRATMAERARFERQLQA
jgi:hypothetical protein